MKNLLYLTVMFSCMAFKINSQTISWSGFPAGGTSYTTGILTATITSSSPGFQNGAPKHYAGNTVGGGECGIAGGLALEHMFGNITNAHSTLTMDYTSGNTTNGLCGSISFQVKDINADESFQTFADWVEVLAIDGNNNPIPVANITATGGSNKTITSSGNTRIVKGYSNNAYLSRSSTLCDDVTFTVTPPAGTTLKSVTLKYHPDYTASPNDYYNFTGPKRPAYQYISISAITVSAASGPTAVVLNTTAASCNAADGTVVIGAVTGGTSPFQFNFNNQGLASTTSFTNLTSGTYPVIVQDNNGCTFSTNALVDLASGPTAIVTTPTNASCGQSDGSVNLGSVTGGSAPYQYNFNNLGLSSTTSYSNLASGSYPLTVEDDNGCTFSTSVTINASSGPTAVVTTPTNASCGQNDGSVTLGAVTGGSSPYQYNFNNLGLSSTTSYSNLASGSYPLTVEDDNGCTFSTSVTINASSGPTAIVTTPTNASCGQNDGSVILGSVSGGISPYQYNFNNLGLSSTTSFSNLAVGTYPLTVEDDNGCTFSTSVTINASSGPTAIASTPTNASCGLNNGSITLGTVSGGSAPFTYNFNGLGFSSTVVFNNLTSGTFSLIIEDDNGCIFNTSVVVGNSGNGPTAVATNITAASCGISNGTATIGAITGGSTPYTYNFNGTGFSAVTAYSNLAAGTYPLIVQDNNGCTFNTSINITSSSGPSAVIVNTLPDACLQGIGSVNLGAITGGTAPYEYNFNGLGFSINSNYSNLAAGTYSVIIRDASGCTFTTSAIVSGTSGPSDINSNMTVEACSGGNGSIHLGTVTGGTAPYTYNFNNLGFSSNVNYTNLSGGNYPLVVNDANGCQYATFILVSALNAGPENVFYISFPGECGAGGTFEIANVTGGTPPYNYVFEGSTVSSLIQDVAIGTYDLQVTDANGCVYNSPMVMPEGFGAETLRIPNVFTPNGDPTNGAWFIDGNCIRELQCVIVNRWGDVMETFDDPTDVWNGTFDSKKVMEGTYFYKATVTFWSGSSKDYHGNITVVY